MIYSYPSCFCIIFYSAPVIYCFYYIYISTYFSYDF